MSGIGMSLFFWKNNKMIDVFAMNLANDFFSIVQPALINGYFSESSTKDKKAKKDRKTVETNLAVLIKKIQQFRSTNKLGTYGKARLQMSFNNRLKELGYDASSIRQLNEYILVRIP
jgi:hypothetical protein